MLNLKREMKELKEINTKFLARAFPSEMLQENPMTIIRFYQAIDLSNDFRIFQLFNIKKAERIKGKGLFIPQDLIEGLQESEDEPQKVDRADQNIELRSNFSFFDSLVDKALQEEFLEVSVVKPNSFDESSLKLVPPNKTESAYNVNLTFNSKLDEN